MKRLNAPKHWMLNKMGGVWAPKPSCGPHKQRECLPLLLIIRNRLKYALTNHEVKMICMQRLVKVDGKVRTDSTFTAGSGKRIVRASCVTMKGIFLGDSWRFTTLHSLNWASASSMRWSTKRPFTS